MPNFRLLVGASAVFLVTSAVSGVTQQQPAPSAVAAPDVTKLGPQVGDKVPEFSLLDQRGNRHTLASLMGPKGLVLAFNRSADW
jgi:cytochrome oxidase Cu insertion factor (SCO1/SenC/PrrC family)